MKPCDKYRDWILTDDLDGEMDTAGKLLLEEHLKSCSECFAYRAQVQKTLGVPFKARPSMAVPAHIWQTIKERIEVEEISGEPRRNFLFGWMESLSLRQWAPALTAALMLALTGTVFLQSQQARLAREKDQGAYLAALLTSGSTSADTEAASFGTPIEKYFL